MFKALINKKKKPEIKINQIRIYPVEGKGNLLGYCSFIINDRFLVDSVKILKDTSLNYGFKLCYPIKLTSEGASRKCFLPIDYKVARFITTEVLKEYKAYLSGDSPFNG